MGDINDHEDFSDTESDLEPDPSFTWDENYRTQLLALADKDELPDDLKWPLLKDAIKYMLKQTFLQWPTSPAPILHPAASLLPSNPSSVDETSISSTSLNGNLNGHDSDSTLGKDSFASNGSLHEDLLPSTSPNTATAALALSSRFQREGDAENSLRDADLQAFFPSKKPAPVGWGGSWGRRLDSEKEVEKERMQIYYLLDEFEGQPPFTIQRLSELVLRPTEHHHTLPKYISALKRLLAITATRDAFPNNVGEGDSTRMNRGGAVNGGWTGRGNGMENGYNYGTGTTMPGSPSTAPLFSPIPFLMKSGDEGMPGRIGSDDGMMQDDDIPGMELGGADRTSEGAVEMAKRSGAGAGTSLSPGRVVSSQSNGSSSSSSSSFEANTKPMPVVRPATEIESTSHLDDSNVTNVGNGPSSNAPLGVPSGMVDELDQLGQKHGQLPPVNSNSLGGGAKALTSTTTSTISHQDESDGTGVEEDSIRAIKRVRSERNLPSLEQSESGE